MKLLLTCLVLVSAACLDKLPKNPFPYRFDDPNRIMEMPHELREISGLTYLGEDKIATHNDEKGKIFKLDAKSGEIIQELRFKKEGDFEGIANTKLGLFIIKSNGTLYRLDQKGGSIKYKLFDEGDEVESLCYLESKSSLLLAIKKCKKKEKDKHIWVYEFDLEQKEIQLEPFLKLRRTEELKHFRVSGMDLHPNGNLFLISGVSNSIMELNSQLEQINFFQLNPLKYPQIEGICFDEKGNLYLASEKSDLSAGKIAYFETSE